jgi:hypothetical protein
VNPPEPGWYRDPYFKNRERYWDGEIWTDESRKLQPALPSGQREGTPAAGVGRHAQTDPVTAQQPAVTRDPVTTQQPATPAPGDTQPIRIFSGGAAGAITILGGGNGPEPASGPPAQSGPVAAGATAGGSAPAGPVDTTTGPPTKEEAAANA